MCTKLPGTQAAVHRMTCNKGFLARDPVAKVGMAPGGNDYEFIPEQH
jgi:hypothetical protein